MNKIVNKRKLGPQLAVTVSALCALLGATTATAQAEHGGAVARNATYTATKTPTYVRASPMDGAPVLREKKKGDVMGGRPNCVKTNGWWVVYLSTGGAGYVHPSQATCKP